jgi:hypothetical protein
MAHAARDPVRTHDVVRVHSHGAHSIARGRFGRRECIVSIRRTHLTFDSYAQIPNAWMRDTRLSRKARGLLAELLTHRVGWDITIESLVAGGPEGRDAMRAAIAELERHGYLMRKRLRRGDGTLSGTDYELREPATASPTAANPTEAGQPTKKTIYQEDQYPEHHDPKPTSDGSGRAMSGKQMTMLVDLTLLLEPDEPDPEGRVRRNATTWAEADELIKDQWQAIEHGGREDIAYAARQNPAVYDRLSPQGRAFVDQEDIVSWMIAAEAREVTT